MGPLMFHRPSFCHRFINVVYLLQTLWAAPLTWRMHQPVHLGLTFVQPPTVLVVNSAFCISMSHLVSTKWTYPNFQLYGTYMFYIFPSTFFTPISTRKIYVALHWNGTLINRIKCLFVNVVGLVTTKCLNSGAHMSVYTYSIHVHVKIFFDSLSLQFKSGSQIYLQI